MFAIRPTVYPAFFPEEWLSVEHGAPIVDPSQARRLSVPEL